MSLAEWFQWLEPAPVSVAIAESIWLFPILEGTNISRDGQKFVFAVNVAAPATTTLR